MAAETVYNGAIGIGMQYVPFAGADNKISALPILVVQSGQTTVLMSKL